MESLLKNRWVRLSVKIVVSVLALYIVFNKTELSLVYGLISSVNILWLLFAFCFFNISKIISATRQHTLLTSININIAQTLNLKLYYVGMFYNLFLPGGIGGDGYKVVYLKKKIKKNTKQIIQAVFLDRLSGLVVLSTLFCLLASIVVPKESAGTLIPILLVLASILSLPVFYWLLSLLFNTFKKTFGAITAYSIGVQLLQITCAYFILKSLDVNSFILGYLTLFLASSVVAILPITIGGIGAREMLLVYAASVTDVEEGVAVAFSLLFFIITAISSFSGVFIKLDEEGLNGSIAKT